MKILVINPGSTSTKIAVYENETPLLYQQHQTYGRRAVCVSRR